MTVEDIPFVSGVATFRGGGLVQSFDVEPLRFRTKKIKPFYIQHNIQPLLTLTQVLSEYV